VTFPAGRLLRPGATTAGWSEGGATALEDETYFVAAKGESYAPVHLAHLIKIG